MSGGGRWRPGGGQPRHLDPRDLDLTAQVGAITLPNAVMTASGTAGQGAELAAYLDLASLGAVVVKSLSAEPWPGNAAPRLYPVAAGMLNSVGLHNPGMGTWIEAGLPPLAATGARVVVSIWGFSAEDYGRVAGALAAAWHARRVSSVVAVEINVSCPNIEDHRRMFAHSASATAAAVAAAASALSATGLPLWAKLSPNVSDIAEIAGAALEAGAEGLTLVNTLLGLAIDPRTGRPRLGGGGGGLSGPALHPVAVRAVHQCRSAFPGAAIIGVGGVWCGEDAAEMMAAGADAVQVGTATFADPRAPARILAELGRWCRDNGVTRLAELRGRAHEQRTNQPER